MFTGIIQDVGCIRDVHKDGDWRIVIDTQMNLGDTAIGASIACSGCCLTVVEKSANSFSVNVSAESLSKTTIQNWGENTRVNLEPSLRLGDELGGHIVSGHVDGLAVIRAIEKEGDSHRLKISVPKGLAKFIAEKGSVALDGISLTVNEVDGDVFGVNIIAHTWNNTTLSSKKNGDFLNIEIDTIARYVAKQLGRV